MDATFTASQGRGVGGFSRGLASPRGPGNFRGGTWHNNRRVDITGTGTTRAHGGAKEELCANNLKPEARQVTLLPSCQQKRGK